MGSVRVAGAHPRPAISLRYPAAGDPHSLPPTVGFAVQVVKNTSIASIIGFVELARAGQLINNATFQPFRVFVAVAVLYFIVCYPLSQLSRWLERRLHAGSNR